MAENQFSFVWFNFGIILVCGIFWSIFLYVVNLQQNRLKISLYHDTISSFCASSDSWSNRFLLTFTILIAMNILCMYTEEYNSRHQESKYLWIFLLECSAASVFPLVGICYTEGKFITKDAYQRKLSYYSYHNTVLLPNKNKNKNKNKTTSSISIDENKQLLDDNNSTVSAIPLKLSYNQKEDNDIEDQRSDIYISKENTVVDCGGCSIPIILSSYIHSIAALYFFFMFTFTNLYYVYNLWCKGCGHKKTFGAYLVLVLAVFNALVLPIFITLQAMIFMRCFASKIKTLRVYSFIFEALTGLFVVSLAVIGSMKRNNGITFFD